MATLKQDGCLEGLEFLLELLDGGEKVSGNVRNRKNASKQQGNV